MACEKTTGSDLIFEKYVKKLSMKKYILIVWLALGAMGLSSCGKETLTPAYKAVTVNELKKDSPVNFSYEIDETQIEEYAKNASKFPLFGKLFQAIAVVLANSTISSQGGHSLELAAVDVDLSTLSALDFDLIQFINLDDLRVFVKNGRSKDSLAFIDKLELYALLDNPVKGLPMNSQGYAKLVYFDKNRDKVGCDGRCIKLNIARVNWKELLKNNKQVRLQPKMIINSVPLSSMKLAGSVNFSIKFNLGF